MKTYLITYCKKEDVMQKFGTPAITCSFKSAIYLAAKMEENIKDSLIWRVMIMTYDLKTQGKNFEEISFGNNEIKEPF